MTTTVDGNSGGTAVTTTTQPTLQGQVLQVVNYQTGALATGTTLVPFDNTIPTNTEGDQYMSLAITPKSATSKLRIDVCLFLSHSAGGAGIASLFQDSTSAALAAGFVGFYTAGGIIQVVFTHYMTSGATSATTFKVRAGSNAAGTITINGQTSAQIMGGASASSITITEVVP